MWLSTGVFRRLELAKKCKEQRVQCAAKPDEGHILAAPDEAVQGLLLRVSALVRQGRGRGGGGAAGQGLCSLTRMRAAWMGAVTGGEKGGTFSTSQKMATRAAPRACGQQTSVGAGWP